MRENGQVVVAVEPNPASEQMQLRALRTADGASWWYAFTSFEEEMKGAEAVQSTFLVELEKLLDAALQVPENPGHHPEPLEPHHPAGQDPAPIIKG